MVPGGVRIDLDPSAVGAIGDTLRGWGHDFERMLAVLLRTDSFLDRLVSAGPLSKEDAGDFGWVGPVARGSGIDTDARRDLAYDGYGELTVAHQSDGDAMARMEVLHGLLLSAGRVGDVESPLGQREPPAAGMSAGGGER